MWCWRLSSSGECVSISMILIKYTRRTTRNVKVYIDAILVKSMQMIKLIAICRKPLIPLTPFEGIIWSWTLLNASSELEARNFWIIWLLKEGLKSILRRCKLYAICVTRFRCLIIYMCLIEFDQKLIQIGPDIWMWVKWKV